MLAQRLSQLGVQTDLNRVTPDDVTAMAANAEQAKLQAQYATVYSRAVKSLLGSMVKTAKTQADLYKAADGKLREIDRAKLDMLKSELGHQTHMVASQAQAESEKQVAQAKQASVVEIERSKLYQRLTAVAQKHQKAIAPKRRGFRLWN